jgi:hypothetical protein
VGEKQTKKVEKRENVDGRFAAGSVGLEEDAAWLAKPLGSTRPRLEREFRNATEAMAGVGEEEGRGDFQLLPSTSTMFNVPSRLRMQAVEKLRTLCFRVDITNGPVAELDVQGRKSSRRLTIQPVSGRAQNTSVVLCRAQEWPSTTPNGSA